MRDVGPLALCHLPNGLAGPGRDHFSVKGEEQLIRHCRLFLVL
jgi:hypothetical protein